jgi:hypothetical protein
MSDLNKLTGSGSLPVSIAAGMSVLSSKFLIRGSEPHVIFLLLSKMVLVAMILIQTFASNRCAIHVALKTWWENLVPSHYRS